MGRIVTDMHYHVQHMRRNKKYNKIIFFLSLIKYIMYLSDF